MAVPIGKWQRMRVTRAYIAGFGTAGSLLAGAAILFVVATAVVSYRGWPQVTNSAASPALVLPDATLYGVGPTPARPVLTADATQPSTSRAAPSPGPTHAIASVAHPRQPTVSTTLTTAAGQGTGSKPPASGISQGSGGTQGQPAPCTSPACASPAVGGLAGTATTLTGAVGSGVSAAGKNLGNTVTAVSGALANKLSGVSPGVSTLVSGVGAALGNAVSQATQTAGGAVAGTGQLLGGILGGLGAH